MSLASKPLDSLTEDDLQSLKDNKVPEGKTIDYKIELPGNSDSSKKEFLYDVSSFANASGGHLIFGIDEAGGIPTDICGLQIDDAEAEIHRMENIIRDGVAPRIPGTAMQAIALQNQQMVIVLRIPRSWTSPHMITFKDASKFYSRNSRGKYPLDVGEIRAAFILSETAAERMRNFRRERLSMIMAQETPILLVGEAKLVLHIIPAGAFDLASQFDVVALNNNFPPPLFGSRSRRLNFDGLLVFDRSWEGTKHYLQIFRNGIIETVDVNPLGSTGDWEYVLPSYESTVLSELSDFLAMQRKLGVEPPLFVMLSFIDVKGYKMAHPNGSKPIGGPIDRDTLIIGEVMIEDFDTDLAKIMKPTFDTIWNACALERSLNYDAAGNWIYKDNRSL